MRLTGIPSSLLSLQEQRELLQSLRQTAFESEGEAPASNFSTERRRSLCAKEFRKLGFMVSPPCSPSPAARWLCHPPWAEPSDGSLILVSLWTLMGHHAVPPSCSLVTPEQRVQPSCWVSKGKIPWLCREDSAAWGRKQELLNHIFLCPRTTATQQRTSAMPHRDSLPSTTWCISPGTPPTPTAGCVRSARELPGREVLVDLHLLSLSLLPVLGQTQARMSFLGKCPAVSLFQMELSPPCVWEQPFEAGGTKGPCNL